MVFTKLDAPPPGVTSTASPGKFGLSFGCPSGALDDNANAIPLEALSASPRRARASNDKRSPAIPSGHDAALYSTRNGLKVTASTPGLRGLGSSSVATVHACQTHSFPQFSGVCDTPNASHVASCGRG